MSSLLQMASDAMIGFLVATYLGLFLGIIEAWHKKAYFALFILLGALAVIGLVYASTTPPAAQGGSSINWAIVAGSAFGWPLGSAAGKRLYREVFN